MKQNNIKLMENLSQKVAEWKITKDKKDMENYFREIFVADIYFDRWLDRFLTRMLDLILEDNFDLDEFMEMNRKYPDSQFHAYIISKKANNEMKNKIPKNVVKNIKQTTIEDIVKCWVKIDLEEKIKGLVEDFKEMDNYTEEELDKLKNNLKNNKECLKEFYIIPTEI